MPPGRDANQTVPVNPLYPEPYPLPHPISLKMSDLPEKSGGDRILSVTDTIVEAPREGKQA
jgi:hypothetical protein